MLCSPPLILTAHLKLNFTFKPPPSWATTSSQQGSRKCRQCWHVDPVPPVPFSHMNMTTLMILLSFIQSVAGGSYCASIHPSICVLDGWNTCTDLFGWLSPPIKSPHLAQHKNQYLWFPKQKGNRNWPKGKQANKHQKFFMVTSTSSSVKFASGFACKSLQTFFTFLLVCELIHLGNKTIKTCTLISDCYFQRGNRWRLLHYIRRRFHGSLFTVGKEWAPFHMQITKFWFACNNLHLSRWTIPGKLLFPDGRVHTFLHQTIGHTLTHQPISTCLINQRTNQQDKMKRFGVKRLEGACLMLHQQNLLQHRCRSECLSEMNCFEWSQWANTEQQRTTLVGNNGGQDRWAITMDLVVVPFDEFPNKSHQTTMTAILSSRELQWSGDDHGQQKVHTKPVTQ